MRFRPNKLSEFRAAMLVAALSAAALMAAPDGAHAQGIFDFLFGGSQQRWSPPANTNSYNEPPPPIGRIAPPPMGPESVHQASGDAGRSLAYCVRLCDGQHFPMEHMANATPVETCRAMCPASKTKVYFGSAIDHAVASDGARYADLDTAFVYRKQLVPNCSCNGKDAFGLAKFDMTQDPTLRPGDIVSTKDGFKAYGGNGAAFTPVDSSAVTAALNGPSAMVQLSRAKRASESAVIDEDPGTITPSPAAPSGR